MIIVALEGIDASGKETQARLLAESLRAKGYLVAQETFPRYNTSIGILLKYWLAGKIQLSDEAAHMLFEADRQDYMKEMRQLEEVFDFLILDRYTLSNLAFGMAKGIDLQWLKGMQKLIRKPDITFVLDITSETSFKRKDIGRDRHEMASHLLNRARAAYYTLGDIQRVEEDALVQIIDANVSPEDIHEVVLSHVEVFFLQPHQT